MGKIYDITIVRTCNTHAQSAYTILVGLNSI